MGGGQPPGLHPREKLPQLPGWPIISWYHVTLHCYCASEVAPRFIPQGLSTTVSIDHRPVPTVGLPNDSPASFSDTGKLPILSLVAQLHPP